MGQNWAHLSINSNLRNGFKHMKCLNPRGQNGPQEQQHFIE